MNDFSYDTQEIINSQFDAQGCYGNTSCTFNINRDWFEKDKCDNLQGLSVDDTQVLMIAQCRSTEVRVGGQLIRLSKEVLAIFVVVVDLFITYTVWIWILMLAPLQKTIENEINKDVVNPMDFTVVVKQGPHLD